MKVRHRLPSRRWLLTRFAFADPVAHSLTLLGALPDANDSEKTLQAIVRVEKTALPAQQASTLVTQFLRNVQLMENTDIVRMLPATPLKELTAFDSTPGSWDGKKPLANTPTSKSMSYVLRLRSTSVKWAPQLVWSAFTHIYAVHKARPRHGTRDS